ncbi:hypothetical protein J7K97_03600 [Candidatus Aerophobetes bacterium]|nr:hypothetical protein [Candidatus Aerophobetes bacterium]
MKRHIEADIVKRRKRKEKLRKLRIKYSLTKTDEEKEKILEKVRRIVPWLSLEEFLEPLKKEEGQLNLNIKR